MLFTLQEAADIEATCHGNAQLQIRIARLLQLQESLARNAYAAASIEGNPLTENQVKQLLQPTFRQHVYHAIAEALEKRRPPKQ
ncbi:MAG: hypothetical protein WC876_08635 [Candidatus Thermoplasmatota archaeon]|jgi:hypothetical protein